ncbi:cohesin domain-containing protein [Clostridium vitabionis]|uniref:cohesin domain-containing protein n=1 Tax=Clostridium vitabionis TaxID=2784388 RepID=UPI00188A6FC2|nr:cohesin domain-containing protein [Clostridium vitabionis]
MKKWRVILAGLFLALICALGTPGWTMEAMAASAAISFSDPQVKTGDSFSVNVKIASADGNIGKTDLMLKYDDKALQFSEGADASGGAGSVHLSASTDSSSAKTVTYTLKFKALAEGSTKITVTSSEIYDTDSKEIKVSKTGSSTVTVTSGTGSTDSSSAAKESGGASGANAALSTQTVEVNGTSYTVAQSFDKKALPDGFSEGSIEYKDASVECATAGEMTLLYLVDGDGNGSFFIYDASADTFSSFITINVEKKTLIVKEPDDTVQIPDGFTETTIELNGNYQVTGWTPSNQENPEYCLIYGQTTGGEAGLYSYDLTEKTIQRYFADKGGKYSDEEVNQMIDSYNSLKNQTNRRMIVTIALAVLTLIFFFTTINLLLRRKDRKEELEYLRSLDNEDDGRFDDDEYMPDLGRTSGKNGREKAGAAGKKASSSGKPGKDRPAGPEIPIRQTQAERAKRLKEAAEQAEKAAREAEAKAAAARAAAEEQRSDDDGPIDL